MLDDKGLTQADYVLRDQLIEHIGATSAEKGVITKMLIDWHKGWSKVVVASQKQFNLMRRLECADEFGYCTCCCTGERYPYKEIDAGHFISATKQATRFDSRNVHPQSKHSNNHKLGDDAKIQYTMFMVENYGRETVEDLQRLSTTKLSWRDHKETLIGNRILWARVIKEQLVRIDNQEPPTINHGGFGLEVKF